MISLCKKSKLQIHSILEIIVIKKNNKDENITKKKEKQWVCPTLVVNEVQ